MAPVSNLHVMRVSGHQPDRYYVDAPASAAGWSVWYRVDLGYVAATGERAWCIENHQGRLINETSRLGKKIIAAVEAYIARAQAALKEA